MIEMVTSGVRTCIVFVKRPFASVAEKLAHVTASVSTVARRLVISGVFCVPSHGIFRVKCFILKGNAKGALVRIGPKSELNEPQCEGTHMSRNICADDLKTFFSKELRNKL